MAEPRRRHPTALRAVAYLALAAGLGALAGVVWEAVVKLPGYTVANGGGASTTERGLAAYFGADAWFALIGLVVGLVLGLLAWWLFRTLGWRVVPLALLAATGAALLCWLVGHRLGPPPLGPRLEAAGPGDVVPIELTVRARSAVLVWPFAAVAPVLFGSALRADADRAPTGEGAPTGERQSEPDEPG